MLRKAIIATILVTVNVAASDVSRDALFKKLSTEIHFVDPFYNPANNEITAASYTKSLDGFKILTFVNKNIVSGKLTVHVKKCSAVGGKSDEDVAAESTVIDLLKSKIAAFERTVRQSSSIRQRVQADYLAEKSSRPFGPGFFSK